MQGGGGLSRTLVVDDGMTPRPYHGLLPTQARRGSDVEFGHQVSFDADGSGPDDSDGDESQAFTATLFKKEDKEVVTMPNDSLEEDMYGMTVCSLVRDLYFLKAKTGTPLSRYARLSTTLFLLFTCIIIQVYLLSQVKHFVSAKAVHDIREAYDGFEKVMYDMYIMPPSGKHRGVGDIKNASVFYDQSDALQEAVCRIPLSQPLFSFTVLFVWSLTCLTEVRKSKALFDSLVWNIDSIDDMSMALEKDDEDESMDNIVGVTPFVKGVIFGIVIIPRLLITAVLLWLGCRWLLATNNFQDLILNAVALEFVLVLKDLIYTALVPPRNKHDLSKTLIYSKHDEQSSLAAFVSTLAWGLFAAAWVVVYMGIPKHWSGLQQVLPGYKWDVHDVCEAWVIWRYCVSASCPDSALDAYHQLHQGEL